MVKLPLPGCLADVRAQPRAGRGVSVSSYATTDADIDRTLAAILDAARAPDGERTAGAG